MENVADRKVAESFADGAGDDMKNGVKYYTNKKSLTYYLFL